MPDLRIVPDGDGSFPEMQGRKIHHITEAFKITAMARGMVGGKPSVAICIPLADGSVVFAETSLALLVTACRVFVAKHGDPTDPNFTPVGG